MIAKSSLDNTVDIDNNTTERDYLDKTAKVIFDFMGE